MDNVYLTMNKLIFMTITAATILASCTNNKPASEERERLLPMEGAYNVRDLGGYQTTDGKTVKWEMIIRSGDLNKLTDRDLECLNNMQIRTFIDFRDSAEIEAAPDKTPASWQQTYPLSIDAGSMVDLQSVSMDSTGTIMIEINKALVNQHQEIYKEFFRIVSDESQAPLLFHCSAGKDRTGLAAALFLAALGVDREVIIEDYLLSAVYLEDKYAEEIKKFPPLEPLMTVKRSYIEAAFNEIDNQYGGVENYLKEYLAVDINTLKKIYTT